MSGNPILKYLGEDPAPTLLLSAANDPFLGPRAYPREVAGDSRQFFFEQTAWGGHVGFHQYGVCYYSEQRALAFVGEAIRR